MKRLSGIIITLILLLACVPTPEQEFVINKAEIVTDEVLLKTAAPVEPAENGGPHVTLAERIGAPAHWTEEEFSAKIPFDSTLTVHIDADVHVPNADRIGVYSVTFDVPFSETQQKGLILKYLGENQKPFRVQEEGKKQRKWEIEEWIRYEQSQLESYRQSTDAEMRDVMTRQTEAQLSQTMEAYRKAPDDWEHLAWDGTCLKGTGIEAGRLKLYAETGQPARYRWINFSAYVAEFRDETLPLSEDYRNWTAEGKSERNALQFEPQTDAERAAASLALETVNALGIGTFAVKSVAEGLDGFFESDQIAQNGFIVRLWMTKDGLPIYNFQAWHGDDPAYARAAAAGYFEAKDYSVYMPEQVTATVGVRDGKVASFCLQGLHQETGCVNDNVQLLPFSEIARIFKEQIAYHYAVGSDDASDDGKWNEQLYVTDAYLSMMRVRKKDSQNEFYLLPVWDFRFYHENIFTNHRSEADAERDKLFSGNYSALTINAVDGSIIDRDLGY